MKNSNSISNLLSDPRIEKLYVLYTIQGVYGEVNYTNTYDVKDGKVCGIHDLEDLCQSSENGQYYFKLRSLNASTPKFTVRFRTDYSDGDVIICDIVGLPSGVTHDMYFNMAQLREMSKSTSVNNNYNVVENEIFEKSLLKTFSKYNQAMKKLTDDVDND